MIDAQRERGGEADGNPYSPGRVQHVIWGNGYREALRNAAEAAQGEASNAKWEDDHQRDVQAQAAHDEWWNSLEMDREFDLMTMNQSRASWREATRRARAAQAPQAPAGEWAMPKEPELFALINSTPVLQSLLYDIDLLPEQITNALNWWRMKSVCSHFASMQAPAGGQS